MSGEQNNSLVPQNACGLLLPKQKGVVAKSYWEGIICTYAALLCLGDAV